VSQVNLLPPELRARQKTKQQTILILGAGVAVLVLLLGYWFLQSQKLSDVNEQVAAQNATNTQIQAQIDQLQQFQQLQW
jgi:Tfp pilus assembly protein PilO